MGKNRITFIPPDIARLSQLRELYLYDNLIETLPSQVGDLKQLQILDVTANKLSYLPAELLRLALTNTWIDRNDFAVDLKWKQKEGPFRIRGASFSKTMREGVLSLRSLCLQIAGSHLIELSQKEGNQELQHQLEILQHQSCLSQLLLDELLQPLSPTAVPAHCYQCGTTLFHPGLSFIRYFDTYNRAKVPFMYKSCSQTCLNQLLSSNTNNKTPVTSVPPLYLHSAMTSPCRRQSSWKWELKNLAHSWYPCWSFKIWATWLFSRSCSNINRCDGHSLSKSSERNFAGSA